MRLAHREIERGVGIKDISTSVRQFRFLEKISQKIIVNSAVIDGTVRNIQQHIAEHIQDKKRVT